MPRQIRVATTREEFDACFASGEAFAASHELAAGMGFYPVVENVMSDDRVFRAGRSGPAGGGLDEPAQRLH